MALHVTVPAHDTGNFTLYAAGNILVRTHEKSAHHFIFHANSVVILFYYFPHFRKAYIVRERLPFAPRRYLPNVGSKVAILETFTSRKFDQLKNVVYYLQTAYPSYAVLPVPFFYRLSALIAQGRNASPYIKLIAEQGIKERQCLV